MTVGLSMIVRNGIDTLPNLLTPEFIELFDQVVVVDTGSTDGTVQYLQGLDLGLYITQWSNDFAFARNYALGSMATDWVIWLDADDQVDLANMDMLIHTIRRLDNVDAVELKYNYSYDSNDNPILVQWRERAIRNPKNWVWKNPVHELLEFCGDHEPVFQKFDILTVEHRPVKRDAGYKDRNWDILKRMAVNGPEAVDTFMLFYVVKEASARGEHLTALNFAIELSVREDALPFQKYEAHVAIARAHYALGAGYWITLSHYYGAICLIPQLNEARAELIDLMLKEKRYIEAMREANQLNLHPPATSGVVNNTYYGSYCHAIKALIASRTTPDAVVDVLEHLLNALDFEYVHPLCHKIDTWLRNAIMEHKIGVVYTDPTEEYIKVARQVAEYLERHEIFDTVICSGNPLVANYANNVYFHCGSRMSLYQEETNPYTTKFLISDNPPDELYGYEAMCMHIDTPDLVEQFLNDCFKTYDIITASSLEEAFDLIKASMAKHVIVLYRNWSFGPTTLHDLCTVFDEPKLIAGVFDLDEKRLFGFAGKRELILKYIAEGDHTTLPIARRFRTIPDDDAQGFNYTWINEQTKSKRIYIYARGVEPWDGCTPYRIGIGASEASVVYLAEQLAKQAVVTVFCPVPSMRTINGVLYSPLNTLATAIMPDVFISSRCPDILTERLGTQQILWLHDLYQHQVFPEGMVVDRIVCVSEQEAEKARKDWGYRVTVIPNPYKRNNTPRNTVNRRLVWLSSPDRGLMNLPLNWFVNLWVTYSFFNMQVMRPHDVSQFQYIWQTKHKLRINGAKLVGRLGLFDLRGLLSTVETWPYASHFEETFCVAALEAYGAGVHCAVNKKNGATISTLERYTDFSGIHHEDKHAVILGTMVLGLFPRPTEGRTVFEEVYPENVCRSWMEIL